MHKEQLSPKERADLAKLCEIGAPYLYQIVSGRRVPSSHLAARIEAMSAGKITRKELRPDDWAQIWPELAHEVSA